MAKIVYNACYGGFGLSKKAVLRGRELSGNPLWGGACLKGDIQTFSDGSTMPQDRDWDGGDEGLVRHDPILVRVVEELGDEASGSCAKLRIDEVTDGTLYMIHRHDGKERIQYGHGEWKLAV